jgi:hypothetical protein
MDIDTLKLPKLSQRDIIYINNEIMNLKNKSEITVSVSEDIKLTSSDIRKLCIKGRVIEPVITKAYLKVL